MFQLEKDTLLQHTVQVVVPARVERVVAVVRGTREVVEGVDHVGAREEAVLATVAGRVAVVYSHGFYN